MSLATAKTEYLEMLGIKKAHMAAALKIPRPDMTDDTAVENWTRAVLEATRVSRNILNVMENRLLNAAKAEYVRLGTYDKTKKKEIEEKSFSFHGKKKIIGKILKM